MIFCISSVLCQWVTNTLRLGMGLFCSKRSHPDQTFLLRFKLNSLPLLPRLGDITCILFVVLQ